jgi:predicted HTH domain antitoxin
LKEFIKSKNIIFKIRKEKNVVTNSIAHVLEERIDSDKNKFNLFKLDIDGELSIDLNIEKYENEIDLNVLISKIDKINQANESKLKKSKRVQNNIFSRKEKEKIKIELFQNGILIDRQTFFEYKSKKCVEFLKNLMSLQYPKALSLKNKIGILECDNHLNEQFNIDELRYSLDSFLSKIPKQYIMKGEVVNFRELIAKHKNPDQPILNDISEKELNRVNTQDRLDLEKTLQFGSKMELDSLQNKDNFNEFSKIKIKLPEKQHLRLRISKNSSLSELKCQLRELLKYDFILLKNFPRTNLFLKENMKLSLEKLDLHPMSCLILQKINN